MGYSLRAGDLVLPLTVQEFMQNFDHAPVTIKQKVIERYGRDGGTITGDRRLASRKLRFTVAVRGLDDQNYDENAAALYAIASRPDLYLQNDTLGYRLALSVNAITPKSEAYRRAEMWTLDAVCPDAAWETVAEQEIIDEYDEYTDGFIWENNAEKTVNNTDPLDAWPVFELTATSSNSEFAIVNVTTGAVIRVGESQFTEGVKITLDSRHGTAQLEAAGEDPVDISQKIADFTGFFALQPGENVLRFESIFGAVFARVAYRLRRPF